MEGKAGSSKEDIRRMMRLTAAKMQLKQKPAAAAASAAASTAASGSSQQQQQQQGPGTDSVKGHPFARYNSLNQLTCILCGCPVKSSLLWRAHLASRAHRDNAESLKSQGGERAVDLLSGAGLKRRLLDTAAKASERRHQRDDGLGLAYSDDDDDDEAAGAEGESVAKMALLSDGMVARQRLLAHKPQKKPQQAPPPQQQQQQQQQQKQKQLPEGFFDDPVADARARHVPYRDKMEEELELFAREMRDAQLQSEQMVDAAEEEADNVRFLEEIITQEETWHRLNELEIMKEAAEVKQEVKSAVKLEQHLDAAAAAVPAPSSGADADDDDDDEAALAAGQDDEFSWRRKKL